MDQLVPAQGIKSFKTDFYEAYDKLVHGDPSISNPNKKVLLDTSPVDFLDRVPILCHPKLPDAINADVPPSFTYFLNLPIIADTKPATLKLYYLVYVVCLLPAASHSTDNPLVNIGSAANTLGGAVPRMNNYETQAATPGKHVREALEEGYEIVHIGLLLLLDIPLEDRMTQDRSWTSDITGLK